ncbi:MAG: glycosyltransferase [Gemmatimonadota bacterium]|jgi:glycosyltransferase involved in cell wall biosynthesis|nr:hypothetical protein [Gemmatimonadota bacterium]MDP6460938.1 glycosyltransferase [Gemmatimonadota bacterium]MDP6802656.1 glycosyltransferase [Gemmatimonadota bacterium]MDP7031655.1 glycosyltransferase [Gemmatimonadota bacterium]
MDILFIVNSFSTGGFQQLTLDLVRQLTPRGFRFRMVCLKRRGSLADELEAAGCPVDAGFLRHKFDVFALWRILRALRGDRSRLIFSEPGRNALLVDRVLAALSPGRAHVSAIHATGRWGHDHMFSPDVRWILRRLNGVIACAGVQKEYLVREEGICPDNLHVIFNGVDHRKFRPLDRAGLPPIADGPAPGEKAVGIVASLTPEKAHDVFVRAARLTLNAVPEARFYILGDGPERERIATLIREESLTDSVKLLGRRRDLPTFLPRLDLLALSSHPFRETLPISTTEGMACGIPTVNTEVGSVRDLVVDGETGWIVPPGDPEALAAAFVRVLEDPAQAARMGAAGRQRVEDHFTLDRTVNDYADYFRRIVGGNQEEDRS